MLKWESKQKQKLNPSAKEFVPMALASLRRPLSASAPEFVPWQQSREQRLLPSPPIIGSHVAHMHMNMHAHHAPAPAPPPPLPRALISHITPTPTPTPPPPPPPPAASHTSSRHNKHAAHTDRAHKIKRTVYVRDIDPRITEEELARAFSDCGVVKACCICGDTQSGLHYGFVEFENADCARAAMGRDCTRIGLYPVRVLASHTTIDPRSRLPPPSADEQVKTARTVYCSFIDKMLNVKDLKDFFESKCGEVSSLRLLDDHRSTTRYAFIEFVKEECAMEAIKCNGMLLGNFGLKVVSSKAPIRPRQK